MVAVVPVQLYLDPEVAKQVHAILEAEREQHAAEKAANPRIRLYKPCRNHVLLHLLELGLAQYQKTKTLKKVK